MTIDYTLYLVTDNKQAGDRGVPAIVEQAIQGGVSLVQLREKDCDSGELLQRALKVKEITDKYDVPLIIDDRVDIMLASDAAGVHVGQSDLPAEIVRKIIGPDKILGVSAGTVEEALKAEKDGADYIGVGAMYPTSTKTDADITTMEELAKIRKAVRIPIVVIGGINEKTIPNFKNMGINGYAVVSAIMKSNEPKKAASLLLDKCRGTHL